MMNTATPPSPNKSDFNKTLDLQINILAFSLGKANLDDWVLLEANGDKMATKKWEILSVNNNGENDLCEL